jgi:hypothetical protein
VFEGPELEAMDRIGRMLWPERREFNVHCMRKFCAFWTPLETIFFLDADIALLASVTRYFEAFDACGGDILYFHPDLDRVYRRGPLREEFERRLGTVGFNSGIFLARRSSGNCEGASVDLGVARGARPGRRARSGPRSCVRRSRLAHHRLPVHAGPDPPMTTRERCRASDTLEAAMSRAGGEVQQIPCSQASSQAWVMTGKTRLPLSQCSLSSSHPRLRDQA